MHTYGDLSNLHRQADTQHVRPDNESQRYADEGTERRGKQRGDMRRNLEGYLRLIGLVLFITAAVLTFCPAVGRAVTPLRSTDMQRITGGDEEKGYCAYEIGVCPTSGFPPCTLGQPCSYCQYGDKEYRCRRSQAQEDVCAETTVEKGCGVRYVEGVCVGGVCMGGVKSGYCDRRSVTQRSTPCGQ